MRHGFRGFSATLNTAVLILAVTGCETWSSRHGSYGPQDPETAVDRMLLPATPPKARTLGFVDSTDTEHLRPQMTGDPQDIRVERSTNPGAVVSLDEETTLRVVVDERVKDSQDTRLRRLLGDRYAFIDSDRLPPEGKVQVGCCRSTAMTARLTYFSHSNNVTVEIVMKNSEIVSANQRLDYLPPEGDDEKDRAIALARQDGRLTGKVQQLNGHAILMQPERGMIWNDPGYGHRIMWVTFSKGQDGDPQFYAIVDLSDEKILEAGEEPKR